MRGPALERGVLVTRTLLAGEREQVHVLIRFPVLDDVEAAGEQDLVDQRVQLCDVALEIAAAFRVGAALQELHRHADPRERRAELVGGVGQERLVGPHQCFDPAGRAVEALGELCDLVSPLDPHAGREVPGPQRLDARLQPLEAARQPPHHRVGADAHRQREQDQEEEERRAGPPVLGPHPGHEPATIAQMDHAGRRAPRVEPAPSLPPRGGGGLVWALGETAMNSTS